MMCKPEDPCFVFQGKLNTMSRDLARQELNSRIDSGNESAIEKTFRRRTVAEAFARANDKGSPLWRGAKQVPFLNPYAYLLQGLTYALIVVDPLDRLEGGFID
mgnify:CR=1 FL=1|tara:strand:+ start:2400 stop:2708 length:309 start_codon:yes stop_codon:yes gene_type:complete